MKKQTKAYIEALLEDYPHYSMYKAQREFELRHPYQERDENVGGGKAQFKKNDAVDRMLITIDEDKRLNSLWREHFAIQVCFEEATEDVQKIVKYLFFTDAKVRKYYSIRELAEDNKLSCSSATAYREFNQFLEEVAIELGLHV
ncbi:phage transcriptional regulator, RinA family [Lactobacillus hominis]|uniref:Phage transcriptional regulator, RinA family n=1 Tax=Lactobacillus hominis DSM 23910 = CRBIP 24.179 TaxID=1423758 RepID=I7KGV9_9LACO|nr:phage transcriptional regulator, RinA family [Lactobacillus hominis]KRM85848.1 hypothetical protein FC41_GL000036 [Lactobacillus hominis DSM 23910 = CRBIP 24.179]MCT3348914.1 transcriptional regulator [Lactobacillus hominis]CCI81605.1 Phage transcriptional regulator, RinA family [Lactobacillus hominis DSM 23910 = CRBIP 24.179]